MASMAAFVLFALVQASVGMKGETMSPIQKTLQLMSDLRAKILAEGEEAKRVFTELSDNCHKDSMALKNDIKVGEADAADLSAKIEDDNAHQIALQAKIDDLAGQIAGHEQDLAAAEKIRAKEKADFEAEHKDLSDIIDMLNRAINILEREMAKHGASMLQLQGVHNLAQALNAMVEASMLDSADASRLTALVQSNSDDGDSEAGAPAGAVYTSQSGNIVDTLKDLLDRAEEQLKKAMLAEQQAVHNFELLRQSLVDAIKFGNKDLDAAKKELAGIGEDKSAAQGDLGVTSSDLAGDKDNLASLEKACMTAAQDYEAAAKSRAEELNAIQEAERVIRETTAPAEKIQYNSFFQVVSSSDLASFEAVRFVRDLARKNNSPMLAQLAVRMDSAMHSGSGDQFDKVKGLIRDMIARLESEASADATEKAYCDKELAETRAKQAEKMAEIEKLTTKIDQRSARSSKLKEQIAHLQQELAQLARRMAEADKVRLEESALFASSKADMEQGIAGIQLALKILREYYARDDKAHAAAEGAGSGIIGLLEVVESDFTKTLAEMVADEGAAKSSHAQNKKANEIERSAKEQDVAYKTKAATDLDKAVAEGTSDRSGVQEELDAVNQYLGGLEKRCIAKAESYADRSARRQAEIAGLKEAHDILTHETALIQRAVHRTLRGHKA